MVDFGKTLLASRYGPWSHYYLDYDNLKIILESIDQQETTAAVLPPTTTTSPSAILPISEDAASSSSYMFVHCLNIEIEKILLFFLEQQGIVASKLANCRRDHMALFANTNDSNSNASYNNSRSPSANRSEIAALETSYNSVAIEVLQLIKFVDLNITGIRKILKKHDKNHTDEKLMPVYFGSSWQPALILHPLISEKDDSLSGLVQILDAAFLELRAWRQQQQTNSLIGNALARPAHKRQLSAPLMLDYSVAEATSTSFSPRLTMRSAKVSSRKSISSSLSGDTNPYKALKPDAVMMHIHAAHRRLRQTSEFIDYLAVSMMMMVPSSLASASDDGIMSVIDETSISEYEELHPPPPPSQFSNILNLLSTFLYMTSYYIVAPSSASYAEKLGSSPVLSGIIIGMTPVAALVSTILYSWWTSYSYKAALIFASTCSILGNVLYAAGLPCNSLALVMVGRLLNGFGSARSINRRYIADTFPKQERTAASAAFVTAGALGMAAGPALASMLQFTVTDGSSNLFWQEENSVGWTMGFIWTVYLVCLVIFFVDPPKQAEPLVKEVHGTDAERTQLLGDNNNNNNNAETMPHEKELPLWKNIPVMTTFWVYFYLKLALEASLSSTAMLTKFYFGWQADKSGLFMAALGLLMLPANYFVARMSRTFSDRELIMVLQVALLFGCLAIMKYTDQYHILQYAFGSVVVFVSANALEGPNMSLLSKTIPKSWAQGIFNIGLLATEAGTLGRAVGDVFLTLCGQDGLQFMLNRSFATMSGMGAVTWIVSYRLYDWLEPIDKDD